MENGVIFEEILKQLKIELEKFSPVFSDFKEVYEYAVLPPGKLFRPLLAYNLALDMGKNAFVGPSKKNYLKFFSSIEIHHAYTLVHDDLPCMDDDDMRRNRPSAHKQFNEWKALLCGDGLLNSSYNLLGHIEHPNLGKLIKFYSWATGPRGLIQGQYLDLLNENNKKFDDIVLTHKLKTARLIQVALLGSYLIHPEKNLDGKFFKDLMRLGLAIGLVFQFLDDLSELEEEQIQKHEKDVNPWPMYKNEINELLLQEYKKIKNILKNYDLKNVELMINNYLIKMTSNITNGWGSIKNHLQMKEESIPVVLLFQSIGELNNTI